MTGNGTPGPELSRVVNLNELPTDGAERVVTADAAERAALAQRFGLKGIAALTAEVRLTPLAQGAIRFLAEIRGKVTQTCVVTLEPVDEEIDENVTIMFRPMSTMVDEAELVLDAEDETEPLMGDTLDIGEIVAEELALALDPYPRKAGLDARLGPDGDAADGQPTGPFAALAKLKREISED